MFTLLIIALAALIALPAAWPWLVMPLAHTLFGSRGARVEDGAVCIEWVDASTGEVIWWAEFQREDLLPVLAGSPLHSLT